MTFEHTNIGDWVECVDGFTKFPGMEYPDGMPVKGVVYQVLDKSDNAVKVKGFRAMRDGREIYCGSQRFKPCSPPPPSPEKEESMINTDYTTTPIATPTLIYGRDISKLSENDLIELTKDIQKKIDDLDAVPGNSIKVKRKAAEAEKALARVIDELDKDEKI